MGGTLESLRQMPGKAAGSGNVSYEADITLPADRDLIDTELREGLFQPRPAISLFAASPLPPQSAGRPMEEVVSAASRWETRSQQSQPRQGFTGPAATYADIQSGGTPRLGLSVYA